MNFKADISNAQLDSMHAGQRDSARSKQPKPQYKQIDKTKKERQAQCGRCGDLRWHSLQQCPAREVICNNCRKKGHYARVCKTKRMCEMHVATVVEDTGEEVAFLGSLSVDANGSPWMTDIHVENLNARFKIDTGADVTAIPEMLYNQGQFSRLERPTRVLLGPGGTRLDVKGNVHRVNATTYLTCNTHRAAAVLTQGDFIN